MPSARPSTTSARNGDDAAGDPGAASDRTARPTRKGELIGEDRRVYERVLEAVMAHRLPPGTKLVESALGELLGVPRTVVRMGLLRLAHDRIVDLLPNRGAAVASPTPQQAREVYGARRLIEGAIAESLAGRLPAARLNELHRIVERGSVSFARDDAAAWIRQAGDFHVRLAECTRNDILAASVRELVTRTNLITALYLQPGRTVYAREARLALVDALAGDGPEAPARAKAAMQALLTGVEARLRPPAAGATRRVDLREALGAPPK